MDFDTRTNTCTVSYPKSGPLSDTVLTEGADLREIPDYTGKSTALVTRLYPVGAHGLTIGDVNGGKNYVENFSYTDRVICKVWKDERYEIPEHLMAAARPWWIRWRCRRPHGRSPSTTSTGRIPAGSRITGPCWGRRYR